MRTTGSVHMRDLTPQTTPNEDRYARQRLMSWWDQDRLANAKVVVAGAGALGNEALKLLALVGVGNILVVDFDTVAPSNLARTVLFRAEDVGQPKARVAAERARELNPDIQVTPIHGDIGRDLGLDALREADVILGGLDSINARWAINRRAYAAGVPWLNAGITASDGQVTRHVPGDGACYECTFTPGLERRFRERYSCTGLVRRVPDRTVATTAIGASVVAALQVNDALRLLHDPGSGLPPGHRLTILLEAHRQFVDELPINPDCPAHQTLGEPAVTLADGPADLSAASVSEAVGVPAESLVGLWLGFDLVQAFHCPICDAETIIGRPVTTIYEDEIRCPTCGAERTLQRSSEIEPSSPLWTRPLAALGVPSRDMVHLRTSSGQHLGVALGGCDPWRAS